MDFNEEEQSPIVALNLLPANVLKPGFNVIEFPAIKFTFAPASITFVLKCFLNCRAKVATFVNRSNIFQDLFNGS